MSRSLIAVLLLAGIATGVQAQPVQFVAGSRVEGHIGSSWSPCIVVGAQLPTGGYRLHCDSLPDPTNVFSESDIRRPGGVQPLPQGPAVQGRFGSNWIDCTQLGPQMPTGGYRLHCPALPDDNVFSESDVRRPTVIQPPSQGRAVQGRFGSVWIDCTQVGPQLPTGGYRLHCPALPDDNVFSESDVR